MPGSSGQTPLALREPSRLRGSSGAPVIYDAQLLREDFEKWRAGWFHAPVPCRDAVKILAEPRRCAQHFRLVVLRYPGRRPRARTAACWCASVLGHRDETGRGRPARRPRRTVVTRGPAAAVPPTSWETPCPRRNRARRVPRCCDGPSSMPGRLNRSELEGDGSESKAVGHRLLTRYERRVNQAFPHDRPADARVIGSSS